MWFVESVESRHCDLDYRNSGQESRRGTELLADGEVVARPADTLDFSGMSGQLIKCSECGVEGCELGNWVSLRKLNDLVLMCPSDLFTDEEDASLRSHYTPPEFLLRRGPMALAPEPYSKFCSLVRAAPSPEEIPGLMGRDLLASLQLQAPYEVLGKAGFPAGLDEYPLVAVTDGELDASIRQLRYLLEQANSHPSTTLIPTGVERIVEFHLDLPGFPAWQPFGYTAGQACLVLECGRDGYVGLHYESPAV